MTGPQTSDSGASPEAYALGPVPMVSLATLQAGQPRLVVDLRAPVEFTDDSRAGSINVPLFEDETRALVGMLYKQVSPEAAFREARVQVLERIAEIVGRIAAEAGWEVSLDGIAERVQRMTEGGIARMESALEPDPVESLPEDAVVLCCARGGLRSRSVVALLRAMGMPGVVGLAGGYRSQRHSVIADLENWTPPAHVFSIRGHTGVGKTLVLREIERMRPGWTLDLEGVAGHRSSLLGMVGLRQASQKAFESGLVLRSRDGFPDGILVMEGESRKVGDAVIPATIWSALQGAVNIRLEASIPRRIQVLSEDYLADPSSLPKLRGQLMVVSDRMDDRPDLAGMLDRGETDELVELLLERYYDPLYTRSDEGKVNAVTFKAEDSGVAAREVVEWIEGQVRG